MIVLSPVECWLVAVLLGAGGLAGMSAGGSWFWVGWAVMLLSSWYLIQSLTREWVWDEDEEKKE